MFLIFLIGFWWFILLIVRSDVAVAVFTKELDVTFVSGADHSNSFFYYTYSLFRNFAPWTIFLYFAVYKLLIKKNKTDTEFFLLSWFFSCFLLLSITPNKQAHYSILLFAPAALITAKMFFAESTSAILNKIFKMVTYGTIAAICIVLYFLPVSLFQPDAMLAKNFAEELKYQQKTYNPKIPVYTVNYLDIPLVFYYGEPIERISISNALALFEQQSNAFLVVKHKAKDQPSSFMEYFKNHKRVELKAGKDIYFLLKIP